MNEFNYTSWMQQNKVGPYGKMNLKESGTGDAPFDFNKAAIESATGDKISHVEEDTYGEPLYWGTKNPNVTYSIGDNDRIIKYDGETGERYVVGDLKHYDDPDFDIEPDTDADYEEPRDDFDMAGDYNDGEFWEGEEKESEKVTIAIPENTDYKELAKAVAKVLIEDYGQHNYKPFMQALIAELK